MSADIKQLRNRIKSVDSTLHLTKAMELVASSKIRRATLKMMQSREYAAALEKTVGQLISCLACRKSPYMERRDGGKTLLAVIAGDRGLAGGYNANVFRLMRDYGEAKVIPIGKRSCDRYGDQTVSAEKFSYAEAKEMAESVLAGFLRGEFNRFGVVYTRYHSVMSQEASVSWLLPLERKEGVEQNDTLFEPNEETVLNAVFPEYLAGMILARVRESFACEVAARRVAMDNAGKNAQEMIDSLGLEYNRVRQGAITQEITEIVAGGDV